jgi:hypothetical protein
MTVGTSNKSKGLGQRYSQSWRSLRLPIQERHHGYICKVTREASPTSGADIVWLGHDRARMSQSDLYRRFAAMQQADRS